MVHIVGAGPGAEDLITVRGLKFLKQADIVIYAGSLVNPGLLKETKQGAVIYDSAKMTLEQVMEVIEQAWKEQKEVVRLHTGDPCIYGAIREQMDAMDKFGIKYDICPGVSSFCGTAAALQMEYTLPGISQSVIITRMAGRTPVPERESIRQFASHQATMVVFLSTGMLKELSEELMAELNCETAFTIPIFGGIPVAESVVVTWIIMAVLIVAAFFLGRNLKVENVGKRQLVVETVIGGLHNFFYDMLGEAGKRYIPYMMTVGIYIAISNMIGLFGLKSPTKDVGVTGALALMSIILVEYAGIHQKGVKGFLKSFAEPIIIMLPMNILEVFIRPLSLCMRLFGNILGAFVIMELIKIVAPVLVPVPLSLYFDLFDGFIQAYVFVFLTSLFIKESIE